jgi:hypothetical protein
VELENRAMCFRYKWKMEREYKRQNKTQNTSERRQVMKTELIFPSAGLVRFSQYHT